MKSYSKLIKNFRVTASKLDKLATTNDNKVTSNERLIVAIGNENKELQAERNAAVNTAEKLRDLFDLNLLENSDNG